MIPHSKTFLIVLAALTAPCASPPSASIEPPGQAGDTGASGGLLPAPLPLLVPLQGVMAGIVTDGAITIFRSAASAQPLSEEDWLTTGLAAINLIGASSLITLAGTGPQDRRRIADPRYRMWAEAMQGASVSIGSAAARQNRTDFLAGARRLADVCDSCHALYQDRPVVPPQYALKSGAEHR